METIRIDGASMRALLLGSVQGIRARIEEINDLNVFPVPDGDTGTNMTKTLEGGLARLDAEDTVGGHLTKFAKGCVLGARGNSGVILSQYMAGVASAVAQKESVLACELAAALEAGVARAYAAVANPVEGTILTVFRESSACAVQNANEDTTPEQLLEMVIESAKTALAKTKEMLPVLAQADVVDSGGAGYLAMLVGMYDALTGKTTDLGSYEQVTAAKPAVDYDHFTTDSTLEWGYCTEALVRLQRAKGEPESFDVDAFVAALEAKDCNSIVALRDGDVLKVHAHTMTPGDVLALCQMHGEFLEVKIENMSLQHSERTAAEQKKKTVHKPYGVIAVASGEGMHALFTDIGADIIIDGGQTANPSAQDFVDAIAMLDCDHVLLLPNNGNILLTAQQAADLCDHADVHVVPTKSFPQGYSALAVFNSELADADEQVEFMTEAKSAVVSGEITFAIRDTVIGDVEVKKDEAIGILDGKLVCSCADETEAMLAMLAEIDDIEDREILTLFVGDGVDEQDRVVMTEAIEEAYEDLSVEVFIGGQQVYRYLVAVE